MVEHLVLNNLAYNEPYARKVLPFLDEEYFSTRQQKTLYNVINGFYEKYNTQPTAQALKVEIDSASGITEDEYKLIVDTIDQFDAEPKEDLDYLVDKTEKFCQEKAVINAIMSSIGIIEGKVKDEKGRIPELLSKALAVSFDTNIGHDFLEQIEDRYEFYHKVEEKIPFDLSFFNKATRGGLSRKTLNVALAGTGVGKSLFMCHCAAANLSAGKNVLYITLEMAEEKIGERIDANLINCTVDELSILPRDAYMKKVERVKSRTTGKLVIKEYPTTTAGAGHFRHLLNELKLKKNFVPDIIYIDYLNICVSSRLKMGANVNSYTYVKAIAEELRGLAVEFNVPIVSATQTTRSGFTSSDLGLEDTSESFGLPATVDFMFALISTEELRDMNQIMVKQLKSRYDDLNKLRRFIIGVDYSHMKLYDVEQTAQDDIVDDGPAFDKSSFGAGLKREKSVKTVFEEFK